MIDLLAPHEITRPRLVALWKLGDALLDSGEPVGRDLLLLLAMYSRDPRRDSMDEPGLDVETLRAIASECDRTISNWGERNEN